MLMEERLSKAGDEGGFYGLWVLVLVLLLGFLGVGRRRVLEMAVSC